MPRDADAAIGAFTDAWYGQELFSALGHFRPILCEKQLHQLRSGALPQYPPMRGPDKNAPPDPGRALLLTP